MAYREEVFILSSNSNIRIDYDKLADDLLGIINQELNADRFYLSQHDYSRSIVGKTRCKLLANRIRPENITYNRQTNFYSVSTIEFKTPNPMLCPWDHENCLYSLFMSVFYLSTGNYFHRKDEPVKDSKLKLSAIMTDRRVLDMLRVPEETLNILFKIANAAPDDDWKLF